MDRRTGRAHDRPATTRRPSTPRTAPRRPGAWKQYAASSTKDPAISPPERLNRTPSDADHRSDPAPHLLISSGPTWEPIDAVRYIGNRSSGKLGAAVSLAAARRGWAVTHLAGPGSIEPEHDGIRVLGFESCADLEELLERTLPDADVLVMAAAVADYRPIPEEVDLEGKRRRRGDMTLELVATPDLLRGCADRSRDDQLLVGFALEPAEGLIASAEGKLARKRIDAIVANPLETMGADSIEASFLTASGDRRDTPGPLTKAQFAEWLIDRIGPVWSTKTCNADAGVGSTNK